MALVFCDSFDHYVTADGGLKGWTYSAGTVTAAIGRNGTAGLRVGNTNFFGEVALPGAGYATIVTGFSNKSTGSNQTGLIQLRNSTTVHLAINTNAGGFIEVRRGLGGTLLGTGSIQMTANVDRYIEVMATIHDSAGTVEVRVNQAVDINLTGQDTRNGGTAQVDNLRFGNSATGAGYTQDFDDLYVCDTTGSVNNTFLGDVRVQAILPNGNGNTSNLVGSDGNSTDNYLLVDEAAQDGDTTYVESSTPGDKDTYAYGNLTPTTGTISGIQFNAVAKKTDAGIRSIATIARHSGTEVDSADQPLGTTYGFYRDIRETKPGGGSWSISDINGAEFGVKVTA